MYEPWAYEPAVLAMRLDRTLTYDPSGRSLSQTVQLVADELESPFRDRLACQAGCAWCCYRNPEALPGEVKRIAEYVVASYPEHELDSMERRLREVKQRLRLDKDCMPKNGWACPFLSGPSRTCRIYPVRPLACRRVHSTDVTVCQIHSRTWLVSGPPSSSRAYVPDLINDQITLTRIFRDLYIRKVLEAPSTRRALEDDSKKPRHLIQQIGAHIRRERIARKKDRQTSTRLR